MIVLIIDPQHKRLFAIVDYVGIDATKSIAKTYNDKLFLLLFLSIYQKHNSCAPMPT
jgi:hypothetical protein